MSKLFANQRGLLQRARKIRLLILDLDGVLTDGALLYDGAGRETKSFHAWDGIGIRLLREISKIPTAIISGRGSLAAKARVKDLGIVDTYFKRQEKFQVLQKLQKKYALSCAEICAMGDDIVDLPLLVNVGLAIAPANAHPLVKKHVHYTTQKSGGHGAVREAIELLMSANGDWKKALARYQKEYLR